MTLTRRDESHLTWLSFAKPPVNSLDSATIQQLIAAHADCAQDPQTRVVVRGGEGRHFCAGADLREQQPAWREGGTGAADLGVALYTAMLSFPKPLIEVEQLGHTGLFVEVVPAESLHEATRRIALAIAAHYPEAARFTKRCMRAVEGVAQLEGSTREAALGARLRDTGVSDDLMQAFLDR